MTNQQDSEMYDIPVNTPWWFPTDLNVGVPVPEWYTTMLPTLKELLLPTLSEV